MASVPLMAVLSLSVPQLVKMISSGSQPSRPATRCAALRYLLPTWPPKVCMLEGLPYISPRYGIISSMTSWSTFVVALLSK